MVVFTCQHCGESVKKPRVEKHYQTKCRMNNPSLTCVDCLKDFIGNEFSSHTQCVSEAQRYSATGTVFKEPAGMIKQAKNKQIIQNLLASSDLEDVQRRLLQFCSGFDNVPRKREKFTNFMTNNGRSLKYTSKDLDSVFTLIENARKNETGLKSDHGSSPVNSKTAKKETSAEVNKDDHEEFNNSENGLSENSVSKKSKKNKHTNTESINVKEDMVVDTDDTAEGTKENINGVSRKELKKQKKYEKYLIELENVAKTENNEKMDCDENNEGGVEENFNDGHTKNKKSKKFKTGESRNGMDVEESAGEIEQKKSKKRKLDDMSNEVEEKKKKDASTEDEEEHQAVFDWTDIIMRVLQSRPDKELSLKRLGKKVIDEYQTIKSDHRTYEELLVKFNKKVKKTKGIRVLKDKAKLIE